jgi:hypothetical protein
MRFEPINAGQRFLLVMAGITALGFGLVRGTTAQSPTPKAIPNAEQRHAPSRGVQLMDVTPTNQTWPRSHLLYDFDKNTVTLIDIVDEGVFVRSISRLDKITPERK